MPPYLAVHSRPNRRGAAAMTIDSLKIEGSGGGLVCLAAGSSSRSSRIVRKARTSAASSWRISSGLSGTLPLGEDRFRPSEDPPAWLFIGARSAAGLFRTSEDRGNPHLESPGDSFQ